MEPNQKLQADVDAYLAKRASKSESISFLKTELGYLGWKRLGNLTDFESLLEDLGFKIEYTYKKGANYITKTTVHARGQA